MNNQKAIVVLDACIIYPAPIRDFLLHLAIENLFEPRWSNKIQDEWIRNLLKNRPDLTDAALRKTVKAMNLAFPEANVFPDTILEKKLILPDENDRHVLATAIKARANYILTFNLKDFPNNYLSKFKVEAASPDDFICDLFQKNPDSVKNAFKNQVKNLRNPPIQVVDLLGIFVKKKKKKMASNLGKLI